MNDILFNLITLVICIGIIIAFRQSDKNNRSIEKAKKYGDKIKIYKSYLNITTWLQITYGLYLNWYFLFNVCSF